MRDDRAAIMPRRALPIARQRGMVLRSRPAIRLPGAAARESCFPIEFVPSPAPRAPSVRLAWAVRPLRPSRHPSPRPGRLRPPSPSPRPSRSTLRISRLRRSAPSACRRRSSAPCSTRGTPSPRRCRSRSSRPPCGAATSSPSRPRAPARPPRSSFPSSRLLAAAPRIRQDPRARRHADARAGGADRRARLGLRPSLRRALRGRLRRRRSARAGDCPAPLARRAHRHARTPARPDATRVTCASTPSTHLVLDEADRMLDMGFIHDVRRIVAAIPAKRQTLLFSATIPNDIVSLANSMLSNPVRVSVTPAMTTAEKVTQSVVFVARAEKRTRSRAHAPPRGDAARHRLHAHQARRQPPRPSSSSAPASGRPPSTETSPRAPASARSSRSAAAPPACSSRPTSRRAASTSTASPTSSTSTCPTWPRATCTASVARVAPEPRGTRCRSAIRSTSEPAARHREAHPADVARGRSRRETSRGGSHAHAAPPPLAPGEGRGPRRFRGARMR